MFLVGARKGIGCDRAIIDIDIDIIDRDENIGEKSDEREYLG